MVKYNGRKIVYTFKHGSCATPKSLLIYSICLAVWFALCIALLIAGCFDKGDFYGWDGVISLFTVGIIFLLLLLNLFEKNKTADSEIVKWLTDEHLFEACAIPFEYDKIRTRTGYAYKYEVVFEKGGDSYRRITSRYESLRNFYSALKSEKGKEINFLYSPKYGEVMVLECCETSAKE